MDSRHGEISRAMRNRGVEIFMMQEVYKESIFLFIIYFLILPPIYYSKKSEKEYIYKKWAIGAY
jgi:midasin (ATPase involved in ribosome maturation)